MTDLRITHEQQVRERVLASLQKLQGVSPAWLKPEQRVLVEAAWALYQEGLTEKAKFDELKSGAIARSGELHLHQRHWQIAPLHCIATTAGNPDNQRVAMKRYLDRWAAMKALDAVHLAADAAIRLFDWQQASLAPASDSADRRLAQMHDAVLHSIDGLEKTVPELIAFDNE